MERPLLEHTLNDWLHCQSSLMDKLKQHSEVVRLKLLSEYWTPASWWDQWMLKEPASSLKYRNIEIWDRDEPCWFARSIFPQDTYLYHLDTFSQLKERPLGALIHDNPRVKRTHFSCYAIDERYLEYYWLPNRQRSKTYWTRFSRFTIEEAPFYLIELFYPHLFRYHDESAALL